MKNAEQWADDFCDDMDESFKMALRDLLAASMAAAREAGRWEAIGEAAHLFEYETTYRGADAIRLIESLLSTPAVETGGRNE